MQPPPRLLLLSTCLASAAVGWAQSADRAPADNAAAVTLDTVRVTADLWESPLDRIPASVSVLDQRLLADQAVRHFGDVVDQLPNLTWTGGTSRPRYLQIRGVGENSQYEGETPDSSVRFLVDDLDFTGLGTLGETFDLAQIEVLRGAQAGAFGANAAGGVVRLVTQAPTSFWTGRIEGSVGGDDLRSGGFAVGGPLLASAPQQLMMRLALYQHTSDGFRRNVTLGRATNARDELTARLRLAGRPSDLWQWDAALLFSDVDNGFDEFALDNNGRRTFSDQPGRDEQQSVAASLRGTYLGWSHVRLTSITSAAWVDSVYSYDDDWTAASYEGFSDLRRDRTVVNQELRLDSTERPGGAAWINRWTLGAFFSRTDEGSTYTNEDPGNVRGLRTAYDSTNYALFGQLGHDFSPRTRLIVGLRTERVELDGHGTRTRFRKARGTFDPVVTVAPEFRDTLVGGKVTLEHDLTTRHLVFGSITRGYKSGGINIDARINPAVDPLTYDTEHLWTYEVGLRGHAWEQRLRGEVVAFVMQREDTQVRDSAGFGGNYRFFTDNAERARVSGVEASAGYALTAHLSLDGSLGLMDSELDRFVLSNGNVGGDRRLANTPSYGYSVGLRYRPLSGLFGSLTLTGRGRQYDSNNHDEARRAFDVVNAALGYAWQDWTVTVWGRNVFNESYDKRVFLFGNEPPDYAPARYEARADPRHLGVTASYRF